MRHYAILKGYKLEVSYRPSSKSSWEKEHVFYPVVDKTHSSEPIVFWEGTIEGKQYKPDEYISIGDEKEYHISKVVRDIDGTVTYYTQSHRQCVSFNEETSEEAVQLECDRRNREAKPLPPELKKAYVTFFESKVRK